MQKTLIPTICYDGPVKKVPKRSEKNFVMPEVSVKANSQWTPGENFLFSHQHPPGLGMA